MCERGTALGAPRDSQGSAWERHYREYVAASSLPNRQEANRRIVQIVRQARSLLARKHRDHDAWIHAALRDPERKWFVAQVMATNVPRRFLTAMIQAAMNERNPSFNRRFVDPCIRSVGRHRVMDALLEYVEHGTNDEKAGAINAMCWAGASGQPLTDRMIATPASNYAPESHATWMAVLERKRSVLLREFIANTDVDVRRSIISQLALDPAAYPDDLKPLIPAAVEIARQHSDPYIRHRVEIQLGMSKGPLQPLPHRPPQR